jgi:MoxR-like ATPase
VTPGSIDEVIALLGGRDYVAPRPLAAAVFLALALEKPLLLEGEAGVGKTEVARALAAGLSRRLIRLQCYEGIDIAQAAYDWDYPRQMLAIRLAEARNDAAGFETRLYSDAFLLKRPLLLALEADENDNPPVLLIDELDRADAPFEAFLLEFLADFRMTIPEYGACAAKRPPIVIITSNRTREIHDAVKRRCLYHWVDYPNASQEAEILRRRAPQAGDALAGQIVAFVQKLRSLDLFKIPGVAETIDWAHALVRLSAHENIGGKIADETLGALLKYQDDIAKVRGEEVRRLLGEIKKENSA